MPLTGVTDGRRGVIFLNLVVICCATAMMSTALTTALPSISAAFDISDSLTQWLTSGYMLTMGILTPASAFFVKRFPTKKLYLATVLLFTVGMAVDVIAPNFYTLMAGRIMQAAANGILMSLAQVVLMTIYPKDRHGQILGWYGLSMTAAPIVSPAVAGIMINVFGWRGAFYIPLLIAAASLAITLFSMVDVIDVRKLPFDMLSFVTCAMMFGGLTLGVSSITTYGLASPITYVPIVFGVAGAAVFIRRQLGMDKPFLELRLFKTRQFSLSIVCSMLYYSMMMSYSVLMPVCYQKCFGYDPAMSGIFLMPSAMLCSFMSPVAGRMYDRHGIKAVMLPVMVCCLVATSGLSFVNVDMNVVLAVTLGSVIGISGCLIMPMSAWCVNSVGSEHRADATALINSLRTVSGALGIAMLMGVVTSIAGDRAPVDAATMDGMNVAFLIMTAIIVAIIVLALFARSGDKARA